MHDSLFENQNALDVPSLKNYAAKLGLNTDKFNKCLDSGEKSAIIDKDVQEGEAEGVSGTPKYVFKNLATGEVKEISGAQPIENFRTVIQSMLQS